MHRRCTCIVQTYGGPEAREAIHLVIFQSCILQNWIFFNFVFFQNCIFSILHFWKYAVCQTINLRAGENCEVYAMTPTPHTRTYTHTHTHKLAIIFITAQARAYKPLPRLILLWWHKLTPPVIKAASTSRPTCTISLVSIIIMASFPFQVDKPIMDFFASMQTNFYNGAATTL